VFLFYLIEIRFIKAGGGPYRPFFHFYLEMQKLFVGPSLLLASIFFIFLGVALFLISKSICSLLKAKWQFLPSLIYLFMISPVANILFSAYSFSHCLPFPRHFIVNYLAFNIAVIALLPELMRAKKNSFSINLMAVCACILMLGSALNFANFMHNERGQYSQALKYILENSRSKPIKLWIDHPRSERLLDFYTTQESFNSLDFDYAFPNTIEKKPDWIIVHEIFPSQSHYAAIRHPQLGNFDYKASFLNDSFSGFSWILYKRK
jgi:hypothetical protein